MQGFKIKTSCNYLPQSVNDDSWLPSFYLSGANALVSREKLLALQGFDDLYSPYYVEDVDLSLRAWKMGWKCYYEHLAVCRHQTSASIKSKDSMKAIRMAYYRNKLYLHYIHFTGFVFFLRMIQLAPELILSVLSGKSYMHKAFFLFLKNLKRVGQSRKKIKDLSSVQPVTYSVFQTRRFIKLSLRNSNISIFKN
jgi:GT2 family glycosyltransferase